MKKAFFVFIIFAILPTYLFQTINGTENENPEIKEENENEEHSHLYTMDQPEFWIYAAISTFLCLFAGLCSGLTVGYLSIDPLTLQMKLKNGTDEEIKSAKTILPILEKHHLLLGTLIVSNAFCMEALPIFLHKIVPAIVAIIISTVFVVIFGEVLPQAYCTGPSQIKIAESMTPIIKIMMKLLWIITYPLSLFLDWLLGADHMKFYEKNDLKALIELHEIKKREKKEHGHDEGHGHDDGGVLTGEEITIINSVFDLRETNVTKVMIPIDRVFMLNAKDKIGEEVIRKIKIKGFSKIPIFDQNRNNVIGILKTKLILDQKYNNSFLSNFKNDPPLIVSKDTSLFEILMIFQDKGQSVALISDENKKKIEQNKGEEVFYSKRDLIVDSKNNKKTLIGLISVKDVFEVMIQKELEDDDIHNTLTQPGGQTEMKIFNKAPRKLDTIQEEYKENKTLKEPLIKDLNI